MKLVPLFAIISVATTTTPDATRTRFAGTTTGTIAMAVSMAKGVSTGTMIGTTTMTVTDVTGIEDTAVTTITGVVDGVLPDIRMPAPATAVTISR
jgi:hypothetical protein